MVSSSNKGVAGRAPPPLYSGVDAMGSGLDEFEHPQSKVELVNNTTTTPNRRVTIQPPSSLILSALTHNSAKIGRSPFTSNVDTANRHTPRRMPNSRAAPKSATSVMSHRSTYSQQSGPLLLDDGIPDSYREASSRTRELQKVVAQAQEKLDLCIAKEQYYKQDVTYHESRLNDKYGSKLNKLEAERDAAFDALNAAQAEKDSAESKKKRNENMIVAYKKNIEDLEFENRQLETTINANEDQMKDVLAPAYTKKDAALEGIQTEYEQSFNSLVEPRRLAHEKAIKEVTEAQQNLQKLAEQKKTGQAQLDLEKWVYEASKRGASDHVDDRFGDEVAANERRAGAEAAGEVDFEGNVLQKDDGEEGEDDYVLPKDCTIDQLHKLLNVRSIKELEDLLDSTNTVIGRRQIWTGLVQLVRGPELEGGTRKIMPNPAAPKKTTRVSYVSHFKFSNAFLHVINVLKTEPAFVLQYVTEKDLENFNTGGNNVPIGMRMMKFGLLCGLAIDKVPDGVRDAVIPEIFKKPGYPLDHSSNSSEI